MYKELLELISELELLQFEQGVDHVFNKHLGWEPSQTDFDKEINNLRNQIKAIIMNETKSWFYHIADNKAILKEVKESYEKDMAVQYFLKGTLMEVIKHIKDTHDIDTFKIILL